MALKASFVRFYAGSCTSYSGRYVAVLLKCYLEKPVQNIEWFASFAL